MIEGFLSRDEGKTLEFKENCRPLQNIVRTAVAFANTAGGHIVIGVEDKTKHVVGVADPLADEERLANAFADGIRPLLVPDIQIHAWRKLHLIVVAVQYAAGPFYVRSEGPQAGVYVALARPIVPPGPSCSGSCGASPATPSSTSNLARTRTRTTSTSEQLPSSSPRYPDL